MPMSLADLVFWLAVACCAVGEAFIVRSVFRSRGREPRAGVPGGHGAGELVWAVMPAVALAVLLVFTWRAMHPAGPEASRAGDAGPAAVAERR